MRNSVYFEHKTYEHMDMEAAKEVYAVLVELLNALDTPNAEWLFTHYVTQNEWDQYLEYQFRDKEEVVFDNENVLGSGGKFRITPNDWHMSCYTEDWNMYRQMLIDQVNPLLMQIRAAWLKRQWAAVFTPRELSTESESH